jgi:predicted dehydrogenase
MSDRLRLGVVGAGRGASVAHLFHLHPDADVVALCDLVPERCEEARTLLPDLEDCYTEFDALLEHDLDTVLIANRPWDHVPLVIKALEAGKNVLSEVVACGTMAEGVALARAVEKADSIYSFAQNTCYYRPVLEMKRLFKEGELGDFIYGEAEYVHERTIVAYRLSHLDHERGEVRRGGHYCTHALGPLIDITGTRPVRCTGFTTPNRLSRYTGSVGDDMYVFICEMSNGALVKILGGSGVKRQPIMHWYSLYGTRGQAENQRSPHEEWLHLYREHEKYAEDRVSYVPKFPYELRWLPHAAGYHGGADVYMVDHFVRAVLKGEPPPFDVYTALDMTLPGIVALRSAWEGSMPMEVPDFRDESVRAKYENDDWRAPRASVHGDVEIPPEVIEERKQRTQEAFAEGLIH